MIRKAVLIAVLLVAMSFGSAFAYQIDSLASGADTTVSPAQVFVNPGGLGDALIYGYYNVRDNNQTFFSVTNTNTLYGERVRIRFREAATLQLKKAHDCDNGSQEVLDFDICLSPGDMWSGYIASDANGAAALYGLDTDTYVQVANPTGNAATDFLIFPTAFPGGQEFKYGSSNLNITADQTREGYFEILGERSLYSPHPADITYQACTGNDSSSRTPCTCGDMMDYLNSYVPNVLMGHTYIVNVPTTQTFAYAATALADFATPPYGQGDITPSPLFGANRPNLRDDSESATITPVNYALTKANIYAILDLDPSIDGKAGLLVTFPTKWATHTDDTNSDGTCAKSPSDIFDDPSVNVTVYDDKEHSPKTVCQFSPCTTPGNDLPDEVNYVDFDNSSIFTTDGLVPIAVAGNFTNFTLGWIDISLVDNGQQTPPSPGHYTTCTAATCYGNGAVPDTSYGLPAVGYQVETFAGSSFSGLTPLQYSTITTGNIN